MFVKIHAPWDTLCKYAEQMNIRMPFRYVGAVVCLGWRYWCITTYYNVGSGHSVSFYSHNLFQKEMLLYRLEEQSFEQVSGVTSHCELVLGILKKHFVHQKTPSTQLGCLLRVGSLVWVLKWRLEAGGRSTRMDCHCLNQGDFLNWTFTELCLPWGGFN